jgi:Zn ribbon nucleic-acid-binding protein
MGMKMCKNYHQEIIYEYGLAIDDDKCPQCEKIKELSLWETRELIRKKAAVNLIHECIQNNMTALELIEQLEEREIT